MFQVILVKAGQVNAGFPTTSLAEVIDWIVFTVAIIAISVLKLILPALKLQTTAKAGVICTVTQLAVKAN